MSETLVFCLEQSRMRVTSALEAANLAGMGLCPSILLLANIGLNYGVFWLFPQLSCFSYSLFYPHRMSAVRRTYGRASTTPPLTIKRAYAPDSTEEAAAYASDGSEDVDGLAPRRPSLVLLPRATKRIAVRPSGSSATSSTESKRLTQSFLDFGQRDFHSVQCGRCGMRYARGLAEDDKDHALFCKSVNKFVRAKGVSADAIVSSRVRYATAEGKGVVDCIVNARAGLRRKFDKLLDKFIAPELGATADAAVGPASSVLLYVADDCRVVGAVVFDCITAAHPAVTPSSQVSSGSASAAAFISCSASETLPARVGVRLLWTHAQFRRQGLASALLDAARLCAVPPDGCAKDLVAFSQPTPDGACLARAYSGSSTVLVFVPALSSGAQ
jgi:hypothetical protein